VEIMQEGKNSPFNRAIKGNNNRDKRRFDDREGGKKSFLGSIFSAFNR
jgi:hypothetical protein